MSIGSPSESTTSSTISSSSNPSSSWADPESPAQLSLSRPSPRPNDRLCAVCNNEIATVSYFTVRICTGCRAFFRRSVKCGKTYQCLNNEMCGSGPHVINRLACKFCRFQRCVDVGMLDAKLQLHSENPDHESEGTTGPLVRLNVFIYGELCEVLKEFSLLKRQLNYERHNKYHGKESKIMAKESNSGVHDFYLGVIEFDLFDKVSRLGSKLFSQIDDADWEELLTQETVTIWFLFSQVQSTVRHSGYELKRIFLVDSSFIDLPKCASMGYWSYIHEYINEEDPEKKVRIFNVLCSYFYGVAWNFCHSVCGAFHRAKLDEAEATALLLLLFTSPQRDVHISDKCAALLKEWRDQTLQGIGEHIERTGRNVEERMAEIIFLMTEFQNHVKLSKHAVELLRTASLGRALPKKFDDLLSRSEQRRSCGSPRLGLCMPAQPTCN